MPPSYHVYVLILQQKLEQLQNLVMQLLQEKQHLHQYPSTPRLSPNMMNSLMPKDQSNAFKVKRAKELGGSLDSSTLDGEFQKKSILGIF